MTEIITLSVDAEGRCGGFSPTDEDVEVGAFGAGLENEVVELADGRIGTVEKVYRHIQTGQSGDSNFVAVDILIEDASDDA